jgi:hypothetical protein
VAAGDGPPHEVRRPGQVAGIPGQPLVEPGLGACAKGQPACLEPVQERRSGGDLVAGVFHVLAGGGTAVEPAAQPAQLVPDGVSVQGAPVLWGPAPGDDPGDPPFQGREALVAGWERARCDQHRSQMNEGAARRQHVERLVDNHAAAWRVQRTPAFFSQSSMRSGRSTPTRASRSRSSSGAAVPPGGVKTCFSFRSRQQRVHSAVDSCQVVWQTARGAGLAGAYGNRRVADGDDQVRISSCA